jgi:hypothetical protein
MGTPQLLHYEAMAKKNRRKHARRLLRVSFPFVVIAGWACAQYFFPTAFYSMLSSDPAQDHSAEAYYPSCAAARAAGVAPISIGRPGYREELDGDDDGIACEPYHPRW